MSQSEETRSLQEELAQRQAEAEERQNLLNQWMDAVHTAEEKVTRAEGERDAMEQQLATLRQQTSGFEAQLTSLQQENRRLQEQLQALTVERDRALIQNGSLTEQLTALQRQMDTRLSTRLVRKLRSLR